MTAKNDNALHWAIIRRLWQQSIQSGLFIPHLGRTEVQKAVDAAIAAEAQHSALSKTEQRHLFDSIVAQPASPLSVPNWLVMLLEEDCDEIIIVGPRGVIIRRQDELISSDSQFEDDLHLLYILNLLLSRADRHFNEQTPAVYVRLPDESEIMALMPPVTETIVASIRINREGTA